MSFSLRKRILLTAGQDVGRCQACYDCDIQFEDEQDIPLGSLVQMVAFNDQDVLECNTLWSDKVLAAAATACKRGLNVQKIMLALRQEARQRRFG